jgi:ketosteroid isomerase-like protein
MRLPSLLLAVALSAGCSATVVVTPSPLGLPTATRTSAPTPDPLIFGVGGAQARMVATFVAFLDAYNSGDVDRALSLMTDDVSISDCDYRDPKLLNPIGRDAARQWLADRAADHDQLTLESIRNENSDPASGSHVVGVSYSRRTSDTLRALGYPNGIRPQAATKVIFTTADDRLRAFANGPFGGPLELCRPQP